MTNSRSTPTSSRGERRLPLGAPVRGWALSEWALVPLRLFLGVTFIYAGLQKLANPNFFNPASPISIKAQLIGAAHTSPLHALLGHLVGAATPIGLTIAVGEVAVGLGTLLGLWTRVAALGGLVLSLSLFLTVSFHASPYFTGADIVFFFAWMPFIVAGGGSRLSLDGFITKKATREAGLASPELVPIPFSTVRSICGRYEKGKCSARGGLDCDAAVCPVLLGPSASNATRVSIERRSVVLGASAVAAAGVTAIIIGGAVAEAGRLIGDAPKPSSGSQPSLSTSTTTPSVPSNSPTTTTTTPGVKGTLLGAASQVPINQAATFTIPKNGEPGIVVHIGAGGFVAYNAVCPHMGCTVGYSSTSKVLVCPCHGSEFQVANGDVIVGPAPHGLERLKVVEGPNGNLYLE